jgi:cytochrome P450/NADPH-cytochrome P450 reductase
MAEVLLESGRRSNRTAIENQFHRASEQQRQENVRQMHQLCDQIVAERKLNLQPDAKTF